ncbi:sigma 54-interacting transcriptional regulator [Pendulispora albinea]|uniref:Sigma 54-interacting transcriptional regulator n=1 Tax=Pendulispora albinea TaxID=2741071 RepID=A0ABZ2LWH4_9BACT
MQSPVHPSLSEETVLRPKRNTTTTSFQLTFLRGPDAGVVLVVDGAAACPVLLGTSEVCSVRLRDPEVSRRHVSLDVYDAYLRVRDLSSKNGTFVNATRVGEALLCGGEEIQIGSTVARVDVEVKAKPIPVSPDTSFGPVLGASLAMRRLYPLCRRLAESDVPLVIEGETGTGKEVMAEALHAASRRASGPFVVFDCTAVPASLLESALFGHEKGAFTGAATARPGVFEEAHGGTLLIDEIGDLEKSLQSKLLRAIQKSEIRRLGGARWVKVDVRLIAATRRDLDKEVQAGRFRDDLFFRLAVARIALPPLRDRRDDIEPLARHFWELYGGRDKSFPVHLLDRLLSHSWPGNVRELANTVARLVALGELADSYSELFRQAAPEASEEGGEAAMPRDFIENVVGLNLPLAEAREQVLREFERRYVVHLLKLHGGDSARAAAASGIGERYLRMIRARVRPA